MSGRERRARGERRGRTRRVGNRLTGAVAAVAGATTFAVAPIITAPPAEALFGLEDLLDPSLWVDPAALVGGVAAPLFGPGFEVGAGLLNPVALGLADVSTGVAGWADAHLGAAFDGMFTQMSQWFDGLLTQLTHLGDPGALSMQALLSPFSGASTAAADPGVAAGTLTSASVPLQVYNTTQPLVNIASGGGREVPVVVDTGSAGLVLPWWDLGPGNIAIPTNLGVGGYSGGINYFYVTLPTTVDFGPDIATGTDVVTGATSVNAVLITWPTSVQSLLATGGTWQGFMRGSGADGVLGVGPNALGPNPDAIPTAALPGALGHGVLIDQIGATTGGQPVLTFGDNPLTSGAYSVPGAPISNLQVSINGGALQSVNGAIIDSGGVTGTLPSSVTGYTPVNGMVPAGTLISVYSANGTPLYSYTTTATNTPYVVNGPMNTGNTPFALQPIYISYSPTGTGATVFGDPGAALVGS